MLDQVWFMYLRVNAISNELLVLMAVLLVPSFPNHSSRLNVERRFYMSVDKKMIFLQLRPIFFF